MSKPLTITLDEDLYQELQQLVGEANISRFIEDLVRPHLRKPDLESGYRQMAGDQHREQEAWEWSEGVIEDVNHETR